MAKKIKSRKKFSFPCKMFIYDLILSMQIIIKKKKPRTKPKTSVNFLKNLIFSKILSLIYPFDMHFSIFNGITNYWQPGYQYIY